MEVLTGGRSGEEGAVFFVVVGGRRVELPWVEYASLRDGVLVLEGDSSGSGTPPTTWLRVWDQAAWQVSLGEEANAAPAGRRVRTADPES